MESEFHTWKQTNPKQQKTATIATALLSNMKKDSNNKKIDKESCLQKKQTTTTFLLNVWLHYESLTSKVQINK